MVMKTKTNQTTTTVTIEMMGNMMTWKGPAAKTRERKRLNKANTTDTDQDEAKEGRILVNRAVVAVGDLYRSIGKALVVVDLGVSIDRQVDDSKSRAEVIRFHPWNQQLRHKPKQPRDFQTWKVINPRPKRERAKNGKGDQFSVPETFAADALSSLSSVWS